MSNTPVTADEIRAIFLFANAEEALLARLTQAASRTRLDGGEFLFHFGEPLSNFYYVDGGCMQLSRSSPSGVEKVIAVINRGETFGEALMFADNARGYPVNARAIESCSLIGFAIPAVREVLRESTDTCFRIMASMSRRLHELVIQIDEITLHNATYRLVAYLLQQLPDDIAHASDIQLVIPKLVIASRLSIQPETFSRILARLRQDGLVDSEGAHIVLKDVAALRKILDH